MQSGLMNTSQYPNAYVKQHEHKVRSLEERNILPTTASLIQELTSIVECS